MGEIKTEKANKEIEALKSQLAERDREIARLTKHGHVWVPREDFEKLKEERDMLVRERITVEKMDESIKEELAQKDKTIQEIERMGAFQRDRAEVLFRALEEKIREQEAVIGEKDAKIAEYHNAYEGKKHRIYELEATIGELRSAIEKIHNEALNNKTFSGAVARATIVIILDITSKVLASPSSKATEKEKSK